MRCLVAILVISAMSASLAAAGEVICKSIDNAINAFRNKQDQKAIACLDYLIETQPGNGDALFLKGKYCFKIKDWDCVRKNFTARPARAVHRIEIWNMVNNTFQYYLNAEDSVNASKLYRVIPGYDQKHACDWSYRMGNSSKQEAIYKYYKLSREFCGNVNDRVIGMKFLEIARQKLIYERKQWLDRAAAFISWDEIHSVFPQTKEDIVFEKIYEGRGLHSAVKALESGKDAVSGDMVSLEGPRFKVAVGDTWVEATDWFKITEFSLPQGQTLNIAAEKGVRVKVKVIRSTRSY